LFGSADAGANFSPPAADTTTRWVMNGTSVLHMDKDPSYDIVQTAANSGHLEAVVKLVEAGASWRLPRGQALVDGIFFAVCARDSASKAQTSIAGELSSAAAQQPGL
jgi:hypothetical protein